MRNKLFFFFDREKQEGQAPTDYIDRIKVTKKERKQDQDKRKQIKKQQKGTKHQSSGKGLKNRREKGLQQNQLQEKQIYSLHDAIGSSTEPTSEAIHIHQHPLQETPPYKHNMTKMLKLTGGTMQKLEQEIVTDKRQP